MAKLKVGDVVETKFGDVGIVTSKYDDNGCWWFHYHYSDSNEIFHASELMPRPDLLPYGKPDAKWWVAKVECLSLPPKAWFTSLSHEGASDSMYYNATSKAAAIRALRKLAIEYGMNVKIMEDEG